MASLPDIPKLSSLPETPTLSESIAGLPDRLLAKGRYAKSLIYESRTQDGPSKSRTGMAVPQGITRVAFEAAIQQLEGRLGVEHVARVDQELKEGWYMEAVNTHDMMAVVDEEQNVASAVVYPASTAEVQMIVAWANEHVVPLFPISMGRNLGYGGAAPRVRGSVVVDLGRRMNKILEIDPDDFTCLVEPGVSYYALHEEIQRRGHTHMWVDVPDLGGGSVLGNALDRGVGYTPYGDHWMMHSGLEVVLPTGEVIRTGMGALPGNNTWQAFPYGFGPYSDGIFSQSNFGIVTKMGMTLMPNPGEHGSFMYTFQKEEDLAQLVEIIRPLRIANILENVAQVRSAIQTIAVQGKPRTHYYDGDGPIPQEIIDREMEKLPCGKCFWIYYGTSYGPAHIRQYKLDIVDKEFMKIPGARRIDPSTIPEDNYFWVRDRIASGTPDFVELLWVNWVPNGSHIALSPVSPIRGIDAMKLCEMAKRRHAEHGIDLLPAFIVGLREMHLIIEIVFDKKDPKKQAAALACLRDMIVDAAKEGYGEYRTHLALMDQVAGTYDWNDNALMRFNEKMKDALDPNGILAPGKSGIWPKRYRGRNWEMGPGKENAEGDGVAVSGNIRL